MTTEAVRVDEKFVEISGRTVRVRVSGVGEPLLLINGLGANVSMWDAAVPDFEGFQVISFDAPGAGKSEAPFFPYTLAHVADVAEQVLLSCGHESADVLGYSLGGAVAQQLAHQSPERVRRLVIVSSTCGSGAVPGSLLALMAVMTPARHHSKAAYRATMKMVNLAPAERDSEALAKRMVNWHHGAAPTMRGYTLQMMAMSRFNSLPWLSSVQHPTLVVTGNDDRIIPAANAGIIAGYLPNAKLLTFDRWGHYLLQDPSSGAAFAIAEFLSADALEDSESWQKAQTVDRATMDGMVRSAPWSAHYTALTSAVVRKRYPLKSGRS